jgi:hypothetical protein
MFKSILKEFLLIKYLLLSWFSMLTQKQVEFLLKKIISRITFFTKIKQT